MKVEGEPFVKNGTSGEEKGIGEGNGGEYD
jgi:hypothetical protein